MYSTTMMTKAVEYHKNLFDNSFAMMTSLQDQGNKMMDLAFEKKLLPDGSKKIRSYWVDVTKQGQNNYKKYVDWSFDRAKAFFASPEPVSSPAPESVPFPAPVETSKK
ncbi:hypothetical protein SAMN02746065_1356 [Desulfocicer vacuolatum DSM 3385]|uniref:Phasin protein n=1 Tax=Desulfocicer vacuolatum DSM 3385 TaxID=1121400 RepID=A0A1W2ELM5_9BACT|nr:hypothetical protein [Desulfocicer vacuolatum]SMD10545.1 hypothetical protein SAMN02746065_1356 [Desulfocicer vacuolatum DSM 3385]